MVSLIFDHKLSALSCILYTDKLFDRGRCW